MSINMLIMSFIAIHTFVNDRVVSQDVLWTDGFFSVGVLSSQVTDCMVIAAEENQQPNRREGKRKKQPPVEMIYVSSDSSMEKQCAQQ